MDFILTKAGWKMPLSQLWGGWLILLGRGQADIQDQGTTHIPHKRILHAWHTDAHHRSIWPWSARKETPYSYSQIWSWHHHITSRPKKGPLCWRHLNTSIIYCEDDMARMRCQHQWQESKTNETRSCEIFALSWWSGGTQQKGRWVYKAAIRQGYNL